MSRLVEISHTGRCHEKEMVSLKKQVTGLTDAIASMTTQSKLQDQARNILELSEQAVSRNLQNKILDSLSHEKMESRYELVEAAHDDTFKWLLERTNPSSPIVPSAPSDDPWLRVAYYLEKDQTMQREIQEKFTNWLANGTGIFHISGKPGAGKSTLMKYVIQDDRTREYLHSWAGEKKLVFASFFFWRHGTEFQRSLSGLLRSLLHSVLTQHPNLTCRAFPVQWETAREDPGKSIQFRQVDIQEAFVGLMKIPEICLEHKFAFFIDGLDEFQGREDTLVKTLFEWAQSSPENIKICVSSRELLIFQQRFMDCPKFRLHEVTHHDIFMFVYDTLRNNEDAKSLYDAKTIADLCYALVQRAEGVFLWVSLALRYIEQGLLLEEGPEELMRSVDVLPTEVVELFQVIFDSIKSEPDVVKRRKAMRFLSLAVDEAEVHACRDRLFLTFLSFMDDYDRNKDFVKTIQTHSTTAETDARLSRCQKQVNGWCRGFLSIKSGSSQALDGFRNETVQLPHRSLIEFFKDPQTQHYIREYSQNFDKMHFYTQSLIAELKVWSPSLGM